MAIEFACLAISCPPEPGKPESDFLFTGAHWWGSGNGEGFKIVSPIFRDLVAFYEWQHSSEWERAPYNPDFPTGYYFRESES